MPAALYTPLDAARLQIRLLTIQSGGEGSRVQCSLMTVALGFVSFDALSYCWGSAHDSIAVEVDGHELLVTSNLATALHHFRAIGVGASPAIWVDAICINQNDRAERSSQVALMSTLYKHASTVNIWLGGPSNVPRESILALKDLAAFTLHHRRESGLDLWPDPSDEDGVKKLRGLLLLSANVYWTRTWIVQEIAFAMRCVVHGHGVSVPLSGQEGHYSSRTFPFHEMLQRMTIQPRGHRFETEETIQLCKRIKAAFYHLETTGFVAKIRNFATEPSYARLLTEIFLRYRPLLATDPRDKVYGMLGLLPSTLSLSPDYTKSVRQVYVELTAELMKSSNDLQIVNDACSGSSDLPSWVPDLRVPCRFPPYFAQKLISYRASAGIPASFYVEESGVLVTQGRCIDTVVEIERGVENISGLQELQRHLATWRVLFDKIAASMTEAYSEPQLNNAFWNAVTHPIEDAELFDLEDAQLCTRIMSADSVLPPVDNDSSAADMIRILNEAVQNYDIFLTAAGHLGHVPRGHVELGDHLVILAGAANPFCAVREPTTGSETYSLRAPCALAPFDTNPSGGEFDGTHPLMDGSWLWGIAGLKSLLDIHEGHGRKAIFNALHAVMIC